MQKTIHKTWDKNHVSSLTVRLKLHLGDGVSDVVVTFCCARSSVGRKINWFTLQDIDGLKSLSPGLGAAGPFSTSARYYVN